MTELAAPQISSLMEALPGIAAVLRSPVANAMVAISRSSVGLEEAQLTHIEELLRYGVRRNLLTQEEVDKVLEEVREIVSKRPVKPAPPVEKIKKPVPPPPPVHRSIDGQKVMPHRPKDVPAPVVKPTPKPVVKAAAAKPVAKANLKPPPMKPAPAAAKKKAAPAPKKAPPPKKPVPKVAPKKR